MTRHVMSNQEVARAFVQNSVEWARTSNNNLWFNSPTALHSYQLPIAWRNKRDILIIRDTYSTMTTKMHIGAVRNAANRHSALINVPIDMLQDAGIGIDDIRGKQEKDGIRLIEFEREGAVYTLLTVYKFDLELDLIRVRNTVPLQYCIRGEVPDFNFSQTVWNALPDEYREKALDGWVAFTGDWFFVGDPAVDARKSAHKIKRWTYFGDNYKATEGLGDYVRGVIYHDGNTMFSIPADGRGPYDKYWYKPVKSPLQPLPYPLPEDLTDHALDGGDIT